MSDKDTCNENNPFYGKSKKTKTPKSPSALTPRMIDFAEKHFRKFPSIENHYDNRFLKCVVTHPEFDGQKWYAFEKIHGSNVCFVSDGDEFGWCKRTSAVKPQDNFPGIDSVCVQYSELLRTAVQKICETDPVRFPKGTVFYLYGELFGGHYGHKDVPENKEAKKIQKGISYSPNNEFLVFDIMYKVPIEVDETPNVPLNFMIIEEILDVCQRFGIPHVPIYSKTIGIHVLDDLLKLESHIETEIYNLFGLPKPTSGIWAEGYVIRPNKTFLLPSGSRAIIKFKDAFFSEVSKAKNPIVPTKITENIKTGTVVMQDYVNRNRYDTLISKYGPMSKNKSDDGKAIGKAIGLFTEDVKKDFFKDYPDKYTNYELKAIVHTVQNHVIVPKVKQWYRDDIAQEDNGASSSVAEL